MEGQLDVCPGSLGTLVIIELLIEDTQHNDYYVGKLMVVRKEWTSLVGLHPPCTCMKNWVLTGGMDIH